MNIKKLFTFLFALLISCFSSVALALTPTGYSPTVPQALCRTATNSWTFCNGADVFGAGTTMTSPVLNSPVINNPSGALFSNPTLYSSYIESKGGVIRNIDKATGDIARTTNGWIEDEKYGIYFDSIGGSTRAEFDSAVTKTGKLTLKLSNVNTSGRAFARNATTLPFGVVPLSDQKNAIPLKPSTTYVLITPIKTNNVPTDGAFTQLNEFGINMGSRLAINTSNKISGTSDWTNSIIIFTTRASTYYGIIEWKNDVTGAISDAWFDINSMTLQEVSSLTPTNTLPETLLPIVQSQISQSTDKSQLNTNEVRAFGNDTRNIIAQQFTVSKTKQYGVTIYKAGNTGTFVNDVIASIQSDSGSDTPSGTVLSKITIPNATWNSYATGDPIRIVFPYIVTPGVKYWVTLEQTTPDASNYPAIQSNNPASSYAGGLLKGYLPSTWTTIDADLKFFTEYSRLSEDMTVVSNGIRTNLMASSKDGLLGGSILDLDNGKWKFNNSDRASGSTNAINSTVGIPNIYTLSGVSPADYSTAGRFKLDNNDYIVWKFDTVLPIKHLQINGDTGSLNYIPTANSLNILISKDNVNWTSLGTFSAIDTYLPRIDTEIVNGSSVFYIKYLASAEAYPASIYIEADIDTSSIPLPTIYPLAVNQFSDSIKLTTAPARAYFRLNKYVNKYGVMMPAIEFTNASANPLGYVPVMQDNSQEASPVLNLLSSSTGYQQSGTGSSVTGGYLLNDGEYMTLTGTNYNFEIDYQLGTGTTAISAITKNIAYLSSNSSIADSTLDASLMANFFLGVKQQGLATAIGDVREDIQDVRGELTDVNEELDRLNGTMFVQTANQTIENTTTETSMFDGGVGSRVIPAHSLKVGDTFSMRLMGYLSGTNGDNATVKIKFGSSELVSNTSTMPATITDVYTELYYQCTVRSIGSAGTAMCQGRTMLNAGVGLATTYLRGLQMTSPVAINTETDNLIDSTYTWGTASAGNSLKVTNAVLELIKQ